MKKIGVFWLMVSSLSLFSGAAIRLGISTSMAVHLTSDFGSGFAQGFSLAYDLTPMFAVEARVGLFASDVTASASGLSQGRMTVAPVVVAAVARFNAGQKFAPYVVLGGGVGLQSFQLDSKIVDDWSILGLTLSESINNGMAVLIGAGLDFALKPGEKPGQGIFLNLEVRFWLERAAGIWSLTDNASQEKAAGTIADLGLGSFLFGVGVKYGF